MLIYLQAELWTGLPGDTWYAMNRILFFSSELEKFCIEEQKSAYALHVPLCDERAKHIGTVLSQGKAQASVMRVDTSMKLKAGIVNTSMGTLCVGEQEEGALACLYKIENKGVFASTYDITVLLAHPRPSVMTRLVRDLSTMGVARIVVYISHLSEKSYIKASLWNNIERIALQGVMQAKSFNTLPYITTHYSLQDALKCLDKEQSRKKISARKVYFSQSARQSFFSLLSCVSKPQTLPWVFALGAERGLSEDEEHLLREKGFTPNALCNSVLRCESATLLAVGMCMSAKLM